jgi:hypothetical protein
MPLMYFALREMDGCGVGFNGGGYPQPAGPKFQGIRVVRIIQVHDRFFLQVMFRSVIANSVICGYEIVLLAFYCGPGGGAQRTILDALGIDDDLGGFRLEGSEFDVGGGGAQGAQEQRGDAVIDLVGDEQAHDFAEAELDGVGVLEGGEGDDVVLGKSHVDLAAHRAALLVEVTLFFVAQGGRSALDAVDLDVLAAADGCGIGGHGSSLVQVSGVRVQVSGSRGGSNGKRVREWIRTLFFFFYFYYINSHRGTPTSFPDLFFLAVH